MDTYQVFGDPSSVPRPASPPPIPFSATKYYRPRQRYGKPVPIPKVKKNPLPYGLYRQDIMDGRGYDISWHMVGQHPMRHKQIKLYLHPWGDLPAEVKVHDIYSPKQDAILARQLMAEQRHQREQHRQYQLQQRRALTKELLADAARDRRLRIASSKKKEWQQNYAAGALQRREDAKKKLLKYKARQHWGYKPIKTYATPIPLWTPPKSKYTYNPHFAAPSRVYEDTRALDYLANLATHFDDPRDAMDFDYV